jgi:xanthine/CO dehydrogenase XdhC/CoxF family maturation factor
LRFVRPTHFVKVGVDASGLTCPIGVGLIKSKLPAAIAVPTSAELLVRLEAAASGQFAAAAPRRATP